MEAAGAAKLDDEECGGSCNGVDLQGISRGGCDATGCAGWVQPQLPPGSMGQQLMYYCRRCGCAAWEYAEVPMRSEIRTS